MTILDPLHPELTQTVLTHEVGTVLPSSTASFEFRLREELVGAVKEEQLPFQVQIKYTRVSDGAVLVRVQTLEKRATADKAEAEQDLDVSVMASNAVQQAAHHASRGDYSKARERMVVNQRLMHRASPSRSAPAPNSNVAANPMYAPSPAFAPPMAQAAPHDQGYAQFVEQAQQLDDLLLQQEAQEAPQMDEGERMSSRSGRRTDAVSNQIYKSKKFVAKK
jgi:hypothetical protein